MKVTNLTVSPKRQKGLTLIELMISMTLGLFLIGGMMSMYLGSTSSDKTRTELSDIEANARLAIVALRDSIQHAGYGGTSISSLDKPFHTTVDLAIPNPSCGTGNAIISGLGTNEGLLNPPTALTSFTTDNDAGDIITVVARPDNPDSGPLFFDCASSPNNGAANYAYFDDSTITTVAAAKARQVACSAEVTDANLYSAFFLRQQTGEPKQLVCYGSRSADADPYVIADNIDNLQIRYGVLTGGIDGVGGSTRFLNADQVDALTDGWQSIISVQVALLVGSSKNVLENPKARSYELLDKTINKTASDHKMYKVYSTTIALPNRTQRDF
ncbi:MAG: PilW family protein [Thiotrichaceae bacterium]